MKVLSIGSGRKWSDAPHIACENFGNAGLPQLNPLFAGELEITHVDTSYFQRHISPIQEDDITHCFDGDNIFEFLEKYHENNFGAIFANRVFEHIPPDKIAYLAYLLAEVSMGGAILNIVVPDFLKVFTELKKLEKCLKESRTSDNNIISPMGFQKSFVAITTEIFNEGYDPHKSVWTPELASYYIETEGYWRILKISYLTWDNRDWYMNIIAKRIGC